MAKAVKKDTKSSSWALISYERAIDVTAGMFFGSEDIEGAVTPISLRRDTLLGTKSHWVDPKDMKPEDMAKVNPQTVDVAFLGQNQSVLSLQYAICFMDKSKQPSRMDTSPEVANFLAGLTSQPASQHSFVELSWRYIWNVFNGRALWRNRIRDEITVHVSYSEIVKGSEEHTGFTSSYVYSGIETPGSCDTWIADVKNKRVPNSENIERLVTAVANALAGNSNGVPFMLSVDTRIKLYNGAQVWPSQEFVREDERQVAGSVSRVLFSVNSHQVQRHTGFHSQKIGNAIRTIDDWNEKRVLAVEPYGFSRKDGSIDRFNSKLDLYSLLQEGEDILEAGAEEKLCFVLACLIRGGVYNFGKKPK